MNAADLAVILTQYLIDRDDIADADLDRTEHGWCSIRLVTQGGAVYYVLISRGPDVEWKGAADHA